MAKADAVEGFSKWAFKAPINRINGARCSKDIHSPALPHLLIEFKGPWDSMPAGRSQCAYNAAFAVYGHNEAIKFHQGHVPNDKKAVVFSMVTNGGGGWTEVFGHFATTDHDGQVSYHQCELAQLPSFTSTYDDFTKACSMIHNLQHLARERSTTLRDMLEAKEIASKGESPAMHPLASPSKHPSSDPASSPSKQARVE